MGVLLIFATIMTVKFMFDNLLISPEKGRAEALGGVAGGFGHRPYLCCVL